MKLSMIRGVLKTISENVSKVFTVPKKSSAVPELKREQHAIAIKENKGNVLIKCWNDGKETWVRKGSRCHIAGLCSKCIGNVL